MGKLSEVIYSSAAEKQEKIVLSNLPDDGNQLVAEAIHDLSSWADKPFFVLTCFSQTGHHSRLIMTHPVHVELPELLISEKQLESLSGGTVMLNDPYCLSIIQQQELVKLLLGKLSLKLIINMKAFPNDLNHSSHHSPLMTDAKVVKLPALRSQSIDIKFAANYFLSKLNLEWNKNIPGIADDCLRQLMLYPWPGQLPQLRETIRQAAFIAPQKELLSYSYLPLQVRNFKATDRDFLKEAVKQAEYEMIYKTLRETNNNKRKTAEILKISRKTLYSKINMYKMNNYSSLQT